MVDLFKFIGDEEKGLGYEKGKIYMLSLEDNVLTVGLKRKVAIMKPHYCPYDSWEKFLENWERA